jgi:hypothetical protein
MVDFESIVCGIDCFQENGIECHARELRGQEFRRLLGNAVRAVRRVETLDTLLGIDVILKHSICWTVMYMFTGSLLASLMRVSKGFGECDVGIPERSLMSLDMETSGSGNFLRRILESHRG